MDLQLRQRPADVVARLRAGRLHPQRVAWAAFLGDRRALTSGLAPWEPPSPPWSERLEPVERVLVLAEMTDRERVWLVSRLMSQAVERGWPGAQPERSLEKVRAWALGKATSWDLQHAREGLRYWFPWEARQLHEGCERTIEAAIAVQRQQPPDELRPHLLEALGSCIDCVPLGDEDEDPPSEEEDDDYEAELLAGTLASRRPPEEESGAEREARQLAELLLDPAYFTSPRSRLARAPAGSAGRRAAARTPARCAGR